MFRRWYHGLITVTEATSILMQDGKPEGSFLVKDSEKTPGVYINPHLFLIDPMILFDRSVHVVCQDSHERLFRSEALQDTINERWKIFA
jgi:hypothetical protein